MSPTKPRLRPHSSSSATPIKSNRHNPTHKMFASSPSRNQHTSGHSSSNSSSNPIQTFINTISRLPPDEWRAKTEALEALVSAISSHTPPTPASAFDCGDDNASIHSSNSHDDRSISSSVSGSSSLSYRSNRSNRSNKSYPLTWNSHRSLLRSRPPSSPSPRNSVVSPTNSAPPPPPAYLTPNTLRQLAIPFRTLLSDLRTLVVKSACHNLSLIAGLTGDKSRGLIKDLLPDMLALHSQTVKVMHGYATAAMLGIIQATKFKTGVGILMREMRLNKSKDVRMACVRYLRHMIDSWPVSYLQTQSESIGDSFAKALVDPCQAVRMEARNAFLRSFYTQYPQAWYKIVHTPDGVISKDPRMKRTILMQSSTIERTSSPSSSTAEEDKKDDKDDRNAVNPFLEMEANTPITKNRRPVDKKPLSIKRRTIAFDDAKEDRDHSSHVTSELQQNAASSIQAAVRGVLLRRSLPSLPPTAHQMTERRKTMKGGVVPPLPPTPGAIRLEQLEDSTSPLSEGGGDQSSSWLTTPQPINRRRSSIPRSSSDRKGRSPYGVWPEYSRGGFSVQHSPATPSLLTPSPTPKVLRRDSVLLQKRLPDAHVSIGRDLLKEHKKNMDKLMSGLKEEMDLISNIERKLRFDLTEDDVLDYFENIYNFMDKRAEVAVELRGTLEKVSRGD